MSYKVENRKYLDTLKMTDSELAVVVSEELCRNAVERRWLRRPTNFMRMTIDIVQPGGTTGKFIVRSYDLSEGGIGFFTGNYVHASTRCRLGITTVDGESLSIDGTIAHCKNVWGHVHFAGVQFDSPVDLSWFEAESEANDRGASQEASEPQQVPSSAELESNSIEQAVDAINELRKLITSEQSVDEIQACIDRLEVALNVNQPLEAVAPAKDSQLDAAEDAQDSSKATNGGNEPVGETPAPEGDATAHTDDSSKSDVSV